MSNADAIIARLAAVRHNPDPRVDGLCEMNAALFDIISGASETTRIRVGRQIVALAGPLSEAHDLSDARIESIGRRLISGRAY
jgi:hypothetical protein